MAEAQRGSKVKVHYTGRLQDGSVFDTSVERDPLEFTIGGGNIIAGFEAAVIGMTPGDQKTETIPATEAYGEYRDELVQNVEKSMFPSDMDVEVGQQLQLTQDDRPPLVVQVAAITDEAVTLDANHPLAGKELTFDIELVEIVA